MGADATLVAAAYRMGMANVPGDWSASFNKQYEGIIAANDAKAGLIGQVATSLGDVATAKMKADEESSSKLDTAFGRGSGEQENDPAWQDYLDDLSPEDQKKWSNIKKDEYEANISNINPEGDLAAGYMTKVANENNDGYQQGRPMGQLFQDAAWSVPTEIHKNISEANKKMFKKREDKQYISQQYARLESWKQDRIKDKGYMKTLTEMISSGMVNTKNMNPQVMALLGQLMDSKGDLSQQEITAYNRKGDDKLMISFTPNRIKSIYDYNKSLSTSEPIRSKIKGLSIEKEETPMASIDTSFKPMTTPDTKNNITMSFEEIFQHANSNLMRKDAENGVVGKINSVIEDSADRDEKSNTFKHSWSTYGPNTKRDLRGFIKGGAVIKDLSTRDITEKGSTFKKDVGNLLVDMDLLKLGIPDRGKPGYADDLENIDLKNQIIDRITNPQTMSDVAFAEEEMIDYFLNIAKQGFDTKRTEITDAEIARKNALNAKSGLNTKPTNYIINNVNIKSSTWENSYVPFIKNAKNAKNGWSGSSPSGKKYKFENGKYYLQDGLKSYDMTNPMSFHNLAVLDGWDNYVNTKEEKKDNKKVAPNLQELKDQAQFNKNMKGFGEYINK